MSSEGIQRELVDLCLPSDLPAILPNWLRLLTACPRAPGNPWLLAKGCRRMSLANGLPISPRKRDTFQSTIEAKKIADVVAVKCNPLQNISAMPEVVFVMKEGVVYRNP